jgi:hypothetical protein
MLLGSFITVLRTEVRGISAADDLEFVECLRIGVESGRFWSQEGDSS